MGPMGLRAMIGNGLRRGWRLTNQEINEAVAQKLGYMHCADDLWAKGDCDPDVVPDFCGDIAYAWEVLAKVESDGSNISLQHRRDAIRDGWSCVIDEALADADTAPMAICLAFLKLEAE